MDISYVKEYTDVEDFTFSYKGKEYFICRLFPGYSAGIANTETPEHYLEFQEMIDNFIVDGKPFKDIVADIEIT